MNSFLNNSPSKCFDRPPSWLAAVLGERTDADKRADAELVLADEDHRAHDIMLDRLALAMNPNLSTT